MSCFYSVPLTIFATIVSIPSVVSQTLRYNVSMPYVSLSAYSNRQSDAFSFTGNQAALAKATSAGVGVYGERRFLLAENSVYGLSATIPTNKGNVGIQLNYAGFTGFNESKLGVAYATSLGKLIDVGIQFNYYGYRIPQYDNASAINVELGMLLHFSDKLTGGIHIYNPVGGKFGKEKEEKLASAFKFGVGYDPSENFTVSAEIVKEENRNVNVTGGIQYQYMKQLFVRVGFVSDTGSGFAGIGVGWKNFRLHVSGSYHPQLGFSPGLLFLTNFKKAENVL
ncbi:MAG: hypothetical protein WEA59_08045 [Ferruginibacter sp.]